MNLNKLLRYGRAAVALVFVLGSCCHSQTVNIWPGVAPGSEKWTQTETTAENTPMGKVVFSVVTPTLTLYLPEKSKATAGSFASALRKAFQSIGFIRFLESAGVLPPPMREMVIDRASAIPGGPLDLEDLKIIVLMVFWSLGEEPDALILDELFVDEEDRLIH